MNASDVATKPAPVGSENTTNAARWRGLPTIKLLSSMKPFICTHKTPFTEGMHDKKNHIVIELVTASSIDDARDVLKTGYPGYRPEEWEIRGISLTTRGLFNLANFTRFQDNDKDQ